MGDPIQSSDVWSLDRNSGTLYSINVKPHRKVFWGLQCWSSLGARLYSFISLLYYFVWICVCRAVSTGSTWLTTTPPPSASCTLHSSRPLALSGKRYTWRFNYVCFCYLSWKLHNFEKYEIFQVHNLTSPKYRSNILSWKHTAQIAAGLLIVAKLAQVPSKSSW